MSLGNLHVTVSRSFIPVDTPVGRVFVAALLGSMVPSGPFGLSITSALMGLTLPVKFYDVQAFGGKKGLGFVGPVEPEVLDFGLVYRYSRRSDKAPSLVYRSSEFCVYHAVNSATIITRPETLREISELMLAI